MDQIDLSHYVPDFKIEINGINQPDLRDSVTRITVNEKVGGEPAQFVIEVADEFQPKLQKFVWLDQFLSPNSPLFFAKDAESKKPINIYMGYQGRVGLKKLLTGNLASLSTSGFTAGIPQLTLTGYDFSHTLITNRQSSGDKRRFIKLEKNDTYDKIATKIAQKLKINPVTDPVTKYRSVMLKNEANYIDFLKEAAKRIGFEFFISRDNLYFVNPRKIRPNKSKGGVNDGILEFIWHRNLQEFVPTLNLSELVPEIEIRGNLSDSMKLVTETAETGKETIVDDKPDMRLTGSQIAKKLQLNRKEIKNMNFNSVKEAKDIVNGQLNVKNDNLITAAGLIVGNPDLLPGHYIKVSEIGKPLSGLYYVTEVTNTIDGGGYSTKFNARKNNILMVNE
jgi:phage protein D